MNISKAERVGGNLIITAPIHEIIKFLMGFTSGEYEIIKTKKKRSSNANKYMWHLCDEIAKKTQSTKEDVYRHAIREVGNFLQMSLSADEIPSFEASWTHDRTGWFVDVVDYDTNGKRLMFAYIGSSTYDTKTMSRLIDYIVEDAKALGIETLTEAELERMKSTWE